MSDLYKEELEELTGKLYRGDLTPLVYDLLKDSNDLKSLLAYLKSEDIEEDVKPEIERPKPAPSFNNWFNNFPTAE